MKWNTWQLIRQDLYSIGSTHWKNVLTMLEEAPPESIAADKDHIPWHACQETVLALQELYLEHHTWSYNQQRAFETLMHKIQNTNVLDNHLANTVEKCNPQTMEWMLQYNCRPEEYLIPRLGMGYYIIREMVRRGSRCRTINNFGYHQDDPVDTHFIQTTTEDEWKILLNDLVLGKIFTTGLLLSRKGREVIKQHLDISNIEVKNVHDFQHFYETYGPTRWLGIYIFEAANYQNFELDRYIRYLDGTLDPEQKEEFYRACTLCNALLKHLGFRPLVVLDILPYDPQWQQQVDGLIQIMNPKNESDALLVIDRILVLEHPDHDPKQALEL